MTETNDKVEVDEEIKELSEEELADTETDLAAKVKELEQKAIRQREKTRDLRAKLAEVKNTIAPEKKIETSSKSSNFDEGQLSYLAVKGIDSDEDIDFTQAELKKAGGTLRELLNNEYFQAKLKARKDTAKVLDATPRSSRKTGNQTNDSLDFHYQKYLTSGKLPEDSDMAMKVINLKRQNTGNRNPFDNRRPM